MKKVAIVIGHNSRSGGATSPYLEQSEYQYFKDVADIVNKFNDNIDIYSRNYHKSYLQEMKEVSDRINQKKYDYVIELHFNSAGNSSANGCEALIYHSNTKAQVIAKSLLNDFSRAYDSKIRGTGIIKVDDIRGRGAGGIFQTRDTYILFEGFFGTNREAEKFKDKEKFAKFLVDFIERR